MPLKQQKLNQIENLDSVGQNGRTQKSQRQIELPNHKFYA